MPLVVGLMMVQPCAPLVSSHPGATEDYYCDLATSGYTVANSFTVNASTLTNCNLVQ